MWFSVAWIEGKKPMHGDSNSAWVTAAQADNRRWFAQPLLYAIERSVSSSDAAIGFSRVLSVDPGAAVHIEDLAGGERRLLAREIGDGIGDLLRPSQPANRQQ